MISEGTSTLEGMTPIQIKTMNVERETVTKQRREGQSNRKPLGDEDSGNLCLIFNYEDQAFVHRYELQKPYLLVPNSGSKRGL